MPVFDLFVADFAGLRPGPGIVLRGALPLVDLPFDCQSDVRKTSNYLRAVCFVRAIMDNDVKYGGVFHRYK